MQFEWASGKRASNLLKHGVDFFEAYRIFEGITITSVDTRRDYGEKRYRTFGVLNGRLMVIIYTIRGEKYRIISMRKANEREKRIFQNRL